MFSIRGCQDQRRQVGPVPAPHAGCAGRAHGRCPSLAAPALPRSALDALGNKVGAARVKPDFCKQDWFLKTPASLRMSQLLVIQMCSASHPVLPVHPIQLGDDAHSALTLSAAAAQAEPLAAAQPGHSHSPGSRHQVCVKPAD